jgi:hypothetical protein
VLPDTRPPETQRLSLCKGKAEREPAVTGGLVMHEQGRRALVSSIGIRDMATGSKRAAVYAAWPACRDLLRFTAMYGGSPAAASISPVAGAATFVVVL